VLKCREKELICELKKKIRVSICLSLHFSITRAACLYIACDSILFWYAQFSVFVSPIAWERTVVVEEVLYTFGVFVLVSVSYGLRVPRRFGGFVQVLQTVEVAVHGRPLTRKFVIFIILSLDKIFEYVGMTTSSRPCGSPKIPRRFGFFA